MIYQFTHFGHKYKQNSLFCIHLINDICDIYYRQHTSFIK